jgi:hypothetical protein
LAAALLLAGCAQNSGSAGPETITGSAPQVRVARAEAEEAPRPVPPDPYKSVQYRGGRDPVSGVAPGLDGQMPAPPTPPAAAKRTATAAKPAAATAAAVSGTIVEVKPGDTLFAIAARNKVTLTALRQANQLTSDKIIPGQRLVLP